MVYFCECKNVLVENITMRNSTSWTLFLHGCDNVSVRGIRIFNPPYAANTDGIDIDTSRFVTVSDCIIDTGDDAITLRGDCSRLKDQNRDCEFVTISNCILASSSSVFRIGVGQVPIRHARISNIVISRGDVGIDFMSSWGTYGTEVSDICFSGISAVNIAHPIYCRGVSEDTPESVHDITVENYYAECFGNLWIAGSPSCRPHVIRLRCIELHVKPNPCVSSDGKFYPESLILIDKADDILLEDICVFWECGSCRKWKQVLKTNDSSEIVSRNCRLPEPEQ